MNRHIVFVAGKKFVLLSEDSSEYVERLAKEVGTAINRISEVNPQMESRSCAILCALDYADDKYKEIDRSKRLSKQAKTVMEQADKHAKQIKELKEQLSKKDKEIKEFKEQLSKKDEEIKKLKKQLEDSKKEKAEKTSPKPQKEKPQNTTETEKTESKKLPQKKEKKHNHPHVNPYKAQSTENKPSQNSEAAADLMGYTPVRQISLFENE